MDPQSGALWVSANVPANSVVQFHLRDAATSAHDLERTLTGYGASRPLQPDAGALLFSCIGRGMGLYGQADHDSNAFRRLVGDVPLGGFFCNGEIGPIQDATFLHGYTSAFAVFTREEIEGSMTRSPGCRLYSQRLLDDTRRSSFHASPARSLLASLIALAFVCYCRRRRRPSVIRSRSKTWSACKRVSDPALSPDGKTVVFSVRETDMAANRGRKDLWSLDLATKGAQPRRLTTHPENDSAPEWSRDGRDVYFLSSRSGSARCGVCPLPAAKPSR